MLSVEQALTDCDDEGKVKTNTVKSTDICTAEEYIREL